MCKAIWLSFGQGNIPEELSQRFARKVRETIWMYHAGIDGPFAAYCQKKFKNHRLRSLMLPLWHNGVKTAGLLPEKTAQENVSLAVGCRVFVRQVEHAMLSSWTAQLGLAFRYMT